MELNEIKKRITFIRKRAKLSARALSLAINKNASYVNLLEKSTDNSFEPSLSSLLKIINICGSSPEEFFAKEIEGYNK